MSSNSNVYINVTGVITVDAPLVLNTNEISIPKSTNVIDGFLAAIDWVIFNGKQDVISIGNFGAAPTAKGLTFSANSLVLQPADSTNPGAITTGTQTIAGNKTFSGSVDAAAFKASGTAAVADGTYTVGAMITPISGTTGTITVKGGIITAIQEAT